MSEQTFRFQIFRDCSVVIHIMYYNTAVSLNCVAGYSKPELNLKKKKMFLSNLLKVTTFCCSEAF